MTKDKKLSDFDRRKLHYQKLWGLNEKNSTGDLRSDMRNWIDEADQEKKKKLSKAAPTKSVVDGITKSRLFYEKWRGDFDHD